MLSPITRKPSSTSLLCAIGLAIFLVLSGGGCSTLSEIRNPDVSVKIDHPPGIGVNLKKVVFASPVGNCSTRLATIATRELMAAGVEIGTDAVMVSHRTEAGDDILRPETGVSQILLSLNDTACDSEQTSSQRKGERKRERKNDDGETEEYKESYTVYNRTTRFNAGVSVRAANLATGEIVSAWEIREHTSDTNTRENAVPDYPSSSSLKDSALRLASTNLMRWLLPWSELVALTFYDAEECAMNEVYGDLASGDPGSAYASADRSIKACDSAEIEAKFRAATYYNAGMLHFLDANHDTALELFERAAHLDPENNTVQRASSSAIRARELQEKIQRINSLADATMAPDLLIESFSIEQADGALGTTFRLVAAVVNDGDGGSAATNLRWYRVRDKGAETRMLEIGTAEIFPLAPGAMSAQAMDMPAGETGDRYRACIDAVEGEAETADNCSDTILGAVVNDVRQTLPDPGEHASAVESPVVEDDQGHDFALDTANRNPQGVVQLGERVYVVDDQQDKVYVYTPLGARVPGADISLDKQRVPTGIASADERLYVVDWSDDKVYVYTTGGKRDLVYDFDLASANGSPTGITHADERFYVVDGTDDKVYAYTTAGIRDRDAEFRLDRANDSAAGIAYAGEFLHVVDDNDGKVYAYTTEGVREPEADIALDPGETPRGIAGNDGAFLVVDLEDKMVRVYLNDGYGL
ncbi:MAG: hypothetical protein OXC80_15085 [Gammaproteobacteria bacterium]|nr:hypothetical protein [Gammaproteobacteria bacterium]